MNYFNRIKEVLSQTNFIEGICIIIKGAVSRLLGDPIHKITYRIAAKLPIKENLIIVESQPDFWDSSIVLYNYISTKRKDLDVRYLSHTEEDKTKTIKTLKYDRGINPLTYYYLARAAYWFGTHTIPDFPKRDKQKRIYIGHGCPTKRGKGNIKQNEEKSYDFVLSIGKGAIIPQSIFCQCSTDCVLPLGYPRNDLLIPNKDDGSSNQFIDKKYKKVILWMPTFRESKTSILSESNCATETGFPLLDTNNKVLDFNRFLEDINICLLVKIHPLQSEKDIINYNLSNIKFLTNKDFKEKSLHLYEMVAKTDALLTDYSSIYYDYLMLDKPIGFILDDIEKYRSDRGFVFDDILKYLAGEHIYDIEQLKQFVLDISNSLDKYPSERDRMRNYFHADIKESSCKRIIEYFKI